MILLVCAIAERAACCRPKPETLKRRALEAKAARHSQKGLRGAARKLGAADRKPGAPKGKPASSSFGRSKAAGAKGPMKGPFAMSATVPMSGKRSEGGPRAAGSPGVPICLGIQ